MWILEDKHHFNIFRTSIEAETREESPPWCSNEAARQSVVKYCSSRTYLSNWCSHHIDNRAELLVNERKQ